MHFSFIANKKTFINVFMCNMLLVRFIIFPYCIVLKHMYALYVCIVIIIMYCIFLPVHCHTNEAKYFLYMPCSSSASPFVGVMLV